MTFDTFTLLPNGLKDLLPPQAEEEARIITLLMQNFSKFGFSRVKPPLVEFEESLLAPGPGQSLARNTFRLMDPVSQQMMGVRADTTAQIARIAGTRLKDSKRPLRLSYAADVLRVNGTQLRPERQFCQVGCELIGANETRDDVEICLLSIKALNDAGVKKLSVDLAIPSLIDIVFEAYELNEVEKNELTDLIQKRERDGIEKTKTKAAKDIVGLLDCSGLAIEAIKKLDNLKLPKETKEPIDNLLAVYKELLEAMKIYGLNDVNLTIDLIERRGFEYKTGVSFTLFAPQVRGELGRGGRYLVSDSSSEEASGFSLYMDSVLQAISAPDIAKKKTVKHDASWQEIKELQEQDCQVSRVRD